MKRVFFMLILLVASSFVAPRPAHAFNPLCWVTLSPLCAVVDNMHSQPVSPARPAGETDGQTAARLSKSLLCDTYGILSGNLGLMAGFLIAVWGLFIWIRNDKLMLGLTLILVGAFLTAIPGLVISFLQGAYLVTAPLRTDSTQTKQPLYVYRNACSGWQQHGGGR
jgi:hypothetical protein